MMSEKNRATAIKITTTIGALVGLCVLVGSAVSAHMLAKAEIAANTIAIERNEMAIEKLQARTDQVLDWMRTIDQRLSRIEGAVGSKKD